MRYSASLAEEVAGVSAATVPLTNICLHCRVAWRLPSFPPRHLPSQASPNQITTGKEKTLLARSVRRPCAHYTWLLWCGAGRPSWEGQSAAGVPFLGAGNLRRRRSPGGPVAGIRGCARDEPFGPGGHLACAGVRVLVRGAGPGWQGNHASRRLNLPFRAVDQVV